MAERVAAAFVDALNAEGPDAWEMWMQANRSAERLTAATPEQRRESRESLRETFGRLTLVRVTERGGGSLALRAESANEGPVDIILDRDDAGRIAGIRFEPAGPDIAAPEDWRDLADLLGSYREMTGVPAFAMAVVKSGEIVDLAAAGVLSLESSAPVDAATSRFHWGSVAKSATGTVIGALVEEGLMDWSTTVGEVFADENVLAAYRDVTIEQLMGHLAGVPTYTDFDENFIESLTARYPGNLLEARRGFALDILREEAPIFAAGEDQAYSNAGIVIAGVMAEAVSGRSWEDLVRTHVFAAAGMDASGFGWPGAGGAAAQPLGHTGEAAGDLAVAAPGEMGDLVALLGPAGNINSTIGDFAKYAAMHLAGLQGADGALQAATVMRLHTPHPDAPANVMPYAFGWGIMPAPDGAEMHEHNGGAGTFYAEIHIVPAHDLAIVLMANAGYAERVAAPLWQAVYARYAGAD